MGVVIDFPADIAGARGRGTDAKGRGGDVVILPVIRIDRYDDQPVINPARNRADSKSRPRASRR